MWITFATFEKIGVKSPHGLFIVFTFLSDHGTKKKKHLKMRFHCVFQPKATNYAKEIESLYGTCSVEESDVILVLGGDGFMLRSLHKYHTSGKPFYGINFGCHGGLMNPRTKIEDLTQVIHKTCLFSFHPLAFTAESLQGSKI